MIIKARHIKFPPLHVVLAPSSIPNINYALILHVFVEFCTVVLSCADFCRVVHIFVELHIFVEFCRVVHSCVELCRVMKSSEELRVLKILESFKEFCRVL